MDNIEQKQKLIDDIEKKHRETINRIHDLNSGTPEIISGTFLGYARRVSNLCKIFVSCKLSLKQIQLIRNFLENTLTKLKETDDLTLIINFPKDSNNNDYPLKQIYTEPINEIMKNIIESKNIIEILEYASYNNKDKYHEYTTIR